MRTDLGSGHSRLKPPTVVGEGLVYPPIQGALFPVSDVQLRITRRRAQSRLEPPVVVTQPAAFVAAPVDVELAPSTRLSRAPRSQLGPPVVIDLSPQVKYVSVNLAYSRRGAPHSFLRPPVDTVGLEDQGRVHTTLAPQPRQGRAPHSRLRAPVVIDLTPQARYLAVYLAYSRRGQPKSHLQPPTVVTQVAAVYYGPAVRLAKPIPRRSVRSTWVSPVVVDAGGALGWTAIQLAASRRPVTKSVLRPPATIAAVVVVYYGPQVSLAYHVRGRAKSRLFPPVIPPVARPVQVTLARARPRPVTSLLAPPTVIDLRPQTYFLATTLTYSRRGQARSHLGPPTVFAQVAAVYYGPQVTLATKPRPKAKSRLSAPTVVGAGVVFAPIQGYLTPLNYALRPKAKSVLRPPTTVVAVVVYGGPHTTLTRIRPRPVLSVLAPPTVIDNRPQTYYLAVSLAYSLRGKARTRLSPPTVVETRIYFGPSVALAYSSRGVPKSRLRPPVVIDLRPQTYYLSVTLAPSERGVAKPRLAPPAVISRDTFFGPAVNLAASRRPKARYGLAAPAVVFIAEPVLYPVSVTLAYSLRGKPKSRLGRPLVVGAVVYYGPSVTLAYSRRGQPKSVLRKPIVIDNSPQTVYLATWLAYSRRGAPKSRLGPPAVINRDTFFGPSVNLAYSRRGRARAGLAAPAVVFIAEPVLYPVAVTLAYSVRGKPKSFLRLPIVVGEIVYYGPAVTLAYALRGAPKSRLSAPTVISRAVFFGPAVHLAYSRRGATKSELRAPTVIDLRPQTYFLSVTLVRNKPQPTTTRLSPSTVTVALPRAERDLRVYLAYSVRGRPKSILRKPVVIDLRPQVYYLAVALAYSRRGKAKSRLSFVAGRKVVYFGPKVTRAYSRRGRPESRLAPPVVVRTFIARPVFVELAYSRRGRPAYELKPPTVVGPVLARRIAVTLAYSRRGQPKSVLNPPTKVTPFFARDILVTLAPQARGKTRSLLVPPAVVREFIAQPLRVHLTPSQTRGAAYGLAAPAVVAIPEPVLYPVSVTLAYSLRGRPVYFYTGITLTIFVPPAGDVCGFDIAESFVCGDTETVVDVCEVVEQGDGSVQGASAGGSTILGSDGSAGHVSGDDQEST